ncbi:MAG: TIGR02147 family protein [Fibrobacterota bacterium]|nr:TIGR02147 family protein [Fibrobacterota bacterium]
MVNIYEYMDYRLFLQEYYNDRKTQNSSFSYEVFARKAGFKSKGFLHHILTGKRKLSKNALFSIGTAMQLEEKAFSFFQNMVAFNQAKSPGEKAFFFKKLMETSPKSPAKMLQEGAYEFYSQWYYNTLRELITLIRFKEDYTLLGSLLTPPISAAQAKKGVQLLLQLGLVEKTRTGYKPMHQAITTGDEAQAMATRDFHKQNMDLAAIAMDTTEPEERDLSCLIVALPESGFETLKAEIQTFRKKLMHMADSMTGPNRIYHINFQFFPTSRALDEKDGRP